MTVCAAPACDRPARHGGLCAGHYTRRYRGQDLAPPIGHLRDYARPRPTVCVCMFPDAVWLALWHAWQCDRCGRPIMADPPC